MQKQTKGYEDPFYDSFEVKLGRATADLDNKAALWISETDLGEGCLFFFLWVFLIWWQGVVTCYFWVGGVLFFVFQFVLFYFFVEIFSPKYSNCENEESGHLKSFSKCS